jgi:hypothetical protein
MRFLTEEQQMLLRQESLKANVLVTMWLDEGPFRICDDTEDMTDGTDTWLGASVLLAAAEIKASSPMAAESVTLTLDGTQLLDAGITDPLEVLAAFMTVPYHQRRVDIAYAFSNIDSQDIELITPVYAGKINHARLVDDGADVDSGAPGHSRLEIVLDSLAGRYRRATYRTRSHDDQLDLTSGTDQFFSFTVSATQAERTLYWGKAGPGGERVIAAGPASLWGNNYAAS